MGKPPRWTARDIVAVTLGLTILLFVVGSWSVRFFSPAADTAVHAVDAWTEILTALIAGLLVWLGGKSTGEDE